MTLPGGMAGPKKGRSRSQGPQKGPMPKLGPKAKGRISRWEQAETIYIEKKRSPEGPFSDRAQPVSPLPRSPVASDLGRRLGFTGASPLRRQATAAIANKPLLLQAAQPLFQQEAKILQRSGSREQIPRLLAHFLKNQEFYLVEELIPGVDLSGELATGGIRALGIGLKRVRSEE